MEFTNLNLHSKLLRALSDEGYARPTPIQELAIPILMQGHDVLGCAQTGTGKTAAFALPILHRLWAGHPAEDGTAAGRASRPSPVRVLVLVPTRELAAQVAASFTRYGALTRLRTLAVFGGVSLRPQIATLRKGVDILVATPGRLLDLVRQHALRLNHVETLVLDEADQMLDMGFIDDLRRIVSYVPMPRQTVMLSATMPAPIRELATAWLQQPKYVAVPRETATPTRIDQAVCFVPQQQKRQVLAHYLRGQGSSRTLIFCRTKHGADKVVKYLDQVGLPAIAIHGNKSQNARQNALSAFKAGTHSILVATDIASRGLQIDAIETVLNFELPETPEVYVHRIGRTARANSSGQALTLCAPEERIKLRQIERLTRVPLREWKTEIHAAQHSSHILPKTSTCVDRRAALGGEASAGHRQPGRPIRHRTSS